MLVQGCLTFEGGADIFLETLGKRYPSTLRNIPKERRPHLHRGGSLKSRMFSASWKLGVAQFRINTETKLNLFSHFILYRRTNLERKLEQIDMTFVLCVPSVNLCGKKEYNVNVNQR